LTTIVQTAEFNGKNLISSAATSLTVLSTVDGSTISVGAQKLDVATLGIDTSNISNGASAALLAVDAAINTVTSSLASLGSAAKRIEVQTDFTTQLFDILKEGVGNLVDADLAEESASLQALQIKQQLGVQALSIANSGPQSILSLRRLIDRLVLIVTISIATGLRKVSANVHTILSGNAGHHGRPAPDRIPAFRPCHTFAYGR
jgi:flagellin